MDFGTTSFYTYLLTATRFLYTTVLAELEIGQMEQTSRPLRSARTTNVPCVYRQAGSFVSSTALKSRTYNFTYQLVCFSWEKEVKHWRPPTHINNTIRLESIKYLTHEVLDGTYKTYSTLKVFICKKKLEKIINCKIVKYSYIFLCIYVFSGVDRSERKLLDIYLRQN